MWRVCFRSWGRDEEVQEFEEAEGALEFATGLRDDDRDGLLEYVNLERQVDGRWVPAE
jgi:hypothetical protein